METSSTGVIIPLRGSAFFKRDFGQSRNFSGYPQNLETTEDTKVEKSRRFLG